ncbi:hypothetical protein [Leptospira fainei]|nr:hypothetical protein [Leptospira fainei]
MINFVRNVYDRKKTSNEIHSSLLVQLKAGETLEEPEPEDRNGEIG